MAYMTTPEVAERFRTSPETIRYWRHIGYGPKSIKAGRKVLYPLDEIETFEGWLRAEADNRRSA